MLCALALVLAAPAAASAEEFVVDSLGDGSDVLINGVCDANSGAPVECTLRAAIEEINAAAQDDVISAIDFAPSFNGQEADKITLGSSLPAVTAPTAIRGCSSTPEPAKPCVEAGYATTTNSPILNFHAVDDSSLSGIALTRGSVALSLSAISAAQTTNNFVLTNSWIGLSLDETATGGNTIGILLAGDHVNNTQIGTGIASDRNVIAYNAVTGIDIENADGTSIAGNYVGTRADGTSPAGNGSSTSTGENIEVTSGAQSTNVGPVEMAPAFWFTEACDGGCNVIADAGGGNQSRFSPQIDLHGEGGETPAIGVIIRGNYIGMPATGADILGLGNAGHAVEVGNATDVTVGGPAAGDMNRINGAGIGVTNGTGGTGLVVQNNQFNLKFDGSDIAFSSRFQGSAMSLNGTQTDPPLITGNRIAAFGAANTAAITLHNEHGTITGNFIGRGPDGEDFAGGAVGIRLGNQTATDGRTLVSGNVIANFGSSTPSFATGIEILGSDGLDVLGNEIVALDGPNGAEAEGIRLMQGGAANASLDNVFGGDQASEENTFSVPRTPIEVGDPTALRNTFGRNIGVGGDGLPFIDLGADGPGNHTNVNNGIDSPTVATAGAAFARGTALPGATVRVFAKATMDPSEVQAYLGRAVADSSGSWTVPYAAQPDGKPVAATQTDPAGNTSELSAPKVTDATPPPAPTIEPGPASPTSDATPTFAMTVSEPLGSGGTLTCRIDTGAAEDCSSGVFTPAALTDGTHTLTVTQTDAAGNTSSATRQFVVDTQVAAPALSGPAGFTRDPTPSYTFSGEDGAGFDCAVDGAATPCDASGFTPGPLGDGTHTIRVRQTDLAGNVSEAAVRSVTVDTRAPQTTGLRRRNSRFDPTPSFRFRSSEVGSGFQCKVDRRRFRPCRSPYTTRRLRPGRHVLRVRAVDRAGNVDPTPLRRVFRVRVLPVT